MNRIYLDNAATSFPKPECVGSGMLDYINNIGATINRSVYREAEQAGLRTLQLRERLCRFFNFDNPTHAIITSGATMSLNMVIKGYLKPGDHCIVSSMEHNAVMRPLVQLEKTGVEFSRIPCNSDGIINPNDIIALIKPNTTMLVLAHASNVCGALQDAEAVGEICKKHNIRFVLDASQSAGHTEVDFKKFNLSALAVPGHKGLMGPSGIGALMLDKDFAQEIVPIVSGGTGSDSHTENIPKYMPDRFEPGTPNMAGIYGLESSLSYIENNGLQKITEHERMLTNFILNGLSCVEGINIVGTKSIENRVGVVSVDFINRDNAECAYRLETEYNILTRCGLHCAPSAHMALGTFPRGTVRFSIGYFNTESDIEAAVAAVKKITTG